MWLSRQLIQSACSIGDVRGFWSKFPVKVEIKTTRGGLVIAEYSELFVIVQAKWLWTSKKIGPVIANLEEVSRGRCHQGWSTPIGNRRQLRWLADILFSINMPASRREWLIRYRDRRRNVTYSQSSIEDSQLWELLHLLLASKAHI